MLTMITPLEIERGLVIRFDPEKLRAHGAAPDRPPARAVQGWHYFVCVGRCGPWSVWVPAFSRHLPGRIRLGFKAGALDWNGQESFVDLEQMWVVPDEALSPASAGVDRTVRGSRNRASWRFLLGPTELEEAI